LCLIDPFLGQSPQRIKLRFWLKLSTRNLLTHNRTLGQTNACSAGTCTQPFSTIQLGIQSFSQLVIHSHCHSFEP